MIRQLNDGLLLSHDFAGAQNGLKTVKVGVDHIFQQGRIVLITITYGVNGLAVYTDGEQRRVAFNFPISQADFAGQIILGTSPVHYDPWLGEVHGLAVYSRELTPAEVRRHYQNWTFEGGFRPLDRDGAIALYSFSERAGQRVRNDVASSPDLQMPERFVVPHKPFLQSPKEHFEANWYYLHDVLVNIAGFVPLGFLLCSYLARTRNGRQAVLFAILAGGTLSFIIEVLQAYIPQRDSGMTDVITNTLGTALGAAIGLRVVSSINSVVNRTT